MKDETYDSSGNLLIENIKLKGNELLGKIKAETGSTDLEKYKGLIKLLAIKCGYISREFFWFPVDEKNRGIKGRTKFRYFSSDEDGNQEVKNGIDELYNEYLKAKDNQNKPTTKREICFIDIDKYHPVLSGAVDKEIWNNSKSKGLKDLKKVLTEDQWKVYKNWLAASDQYDEYGRIATQECDLLRNSLEKTLLKDKNIVSNPYWYIPEWHPLSELAMQCWILKQCPELDFFAGLENNYGVKDVDLIKLYPVLWNKDRIATVLYPIFTNFTYGPNIFIWHSMHKLKGKKWNLYLISIDIGKILNLPSFKVFKVGITTKKSCCRKR